MPEARVTTELLLGASLVTAIVDAVLLALAGRVRPETFRRLKWPLAFGLVALFFWSISTRASRWPAVWFCLLGGLVSIPGHAWGMSRGLMRVPLLSQASPAAALLFGFFEFIVYFAAIVGLSLVVLRLRERPEATRPA